MIRDDMRARYSKNCHSGAPDSGCVTVLYYFRKGVILMILVTRINKVSQFYINEDMIEFIEETPDTILTLESGKKIAIMESAIEVVEKIRNEKIRIRRATEF